MFDFAPHIRRRRLSLTPMIDVVFLLLVFFMLTAQFTRDLSLPIGGGQAGADYDGPPRLVEVGTDDLRLNGRALELPALIAALRDLAPDPDDIIVLRGDGASLQGLVDVMQALTEAGFTRLVLVE